MNIRRLVIAIAVMIIGISGVSGAAGVKVMAARAENADQRTYTEDELCCMAQYYYMRMHGVWPEGVQIHVWRDDVYKIEVWEDLGGGEIDPDAPSDGEYNIDVHGKGNDALYGDDIDLTLYSKVYSPGELCRMAQDYYYEMYDFYPPKAEATDNGDGTYTICLYDTINDVDGIAHSSTYGWYTVNVCGVGTDDLTGEAIDINP